MKILLLVNGDVSAYYSASLMQHGHQIIARRGGAFVKKYLECDGCLLVSDDPQMMEIAGHFGDAGKPVWRSLADVPRGKMGHARLLYVLVPLFLMVVGALVIKQPWFREEAKPVPVLENPPIASELTAPVVDK